MTHSEVSGYFVGRALDHMAEAPFRFAVLVLKKALLFWSGIEIVSEQDLNAARAESALLGRLPGNFAALFSAGLLGLILAVRNGTRRRDEPRFDARAVLRRLQPAAGGVGASRADLVLILLLVGTHFVSFLPFFITARYRVPITPFIIVFAAYGAVRTATFMAQRRAAAAAASIALAAAIYGVNSVDFFKVSNDGFKAKYDRAVAYGKQGLTDPAIACYGQALQIRPNSAKAHNNLAIVLAQQGSVDQALGHYAAALEIDPDYAEAHNNLGIELARLGRLDEAIGHYGQALRLRPGFPMARKNLALALALQGRDDEAIREYRHALRLEPSDSGAHYNLGVLLSRQGRLDQAISEYRQALRINPDYAQARRALRAALAERRGPDPR